MTRESAGVDSEVKPPDPASNRRNVICNVGAFATQTAIGLWFTPYLIASLGVGLYGLVPLATNITSYMGVLTIAISGTIGRFVTVNLAKGDVDAARRAFNTSLFASAFLALILLPLAAVISWWSPSLLNVPPGHEQDLQLLLFCAFLSFLMTTVGSNFAVSTFARSRFDVSSAIETSFVVSRTGGTWLLFTWLSPRLWFVGLATVMGGVVRQIGYWRAWRKLTPALRVQPALFDTAQLRAVGAMGGWLILTHMGALLFLQTDLAVINWTLGVDPAGMYAPLLQLSMLMRGLASVIANVISPTVMTMWARADITGMVRVAGRGVKLLGLALALPIGLLCGFGGRLLSAWLGPEFAGQANLLRLMLFPLCANLAAGALFAIPQAANRVRWPGIVTLILGIGQVALAITLVMTTSLGSTGVALAGAVVLTMKNALFTPWYCAHILRRPPWTFIAPMVPSFVGAVAIAGAAYLVADAFGLTSLISLAAAGAGIGLVYAPLCLLLGFRHSERLAVIRLITGRRDEAPSVQPVDVPTVGDGE